MAENINKPEHNTRFGRLFRRAQKVKRVELNRPTAEALSHASSYWRTCGAENTDAGQTLGTWGDFASLSIPDLPVRVIAYADPASEPRQLNEDKPDYELVRLLGIGGMGEVWQAYQPALGRSVALKLAKQIDGDNKTTQSRFAAEAKITSELRHPGIVVIHELGISQDKRLFYAMPENTGELWRHAITNKTIPENIDILLRVASAVSYAHARGILHRDLKPDNVYLGEHGEVVLGDWGVSVSVSGDGKAPGLTPHTAFSGTPRYMAPEQALGDWQRIGFATDVYLLGGVLLEILTGETPHVGENGIDCLSRAAKNELPLLSKSTPLLRVAQKALSTKPEDRYANANEFIMAVKEACSPNRHRKMIHNLVGRPIWFFVRTILFACILLVALVLIPRFYREGDNSVSYVFGELWQAVKDSVGYTPKGIPPTGEPSIEKLSYADILATYGQRVNFIMSSGGDSPTATSLRTIPAEAKQMLVEWERMGGKDKSSYLAKLSQSDPGDTILLYLLTDAWQDKAKYIYDTDRILPLMRERYKNSSPGIVLFAEMRDVPPINYDGPSIVPVDVTYSEAGKLSQRRVMIRIIKENGLYYVDWEHLNTKGNIGNGRINE